MRIEPATEVTPELLEALATLIPQLNPDLAVPTAESLGAVFADPAARLLVAREGPKIVGTAMVVVYPTPLRLKARIEDVVVDEGARGRGVGKALVTECISAARSLGAHVVELQSARSREAANRLYPRMGFELRDSNVYRLTIR